MELQIINMKTQGQIYSRRGAKNDIYGTYFFSNIVFVIIQFVFTKYEVEN